MSVTSWTELILIASAIGGAIGWLIKFHSDRRKENRELGKIDVETFALLRDQVGEMEEKIVQLRADNEDLRAQIAVLRMETDNEDRQLNELKTAFKALLKWLDDNGVKGYPRPDDKLLETDPRMKSLRGKK